METPKPNISPFPEFRSDLSLWKEGLKVVEGMIQHPEGYEFEAQLSEIIGYMPEEEMQAINNYVGLTGKFGMDFKRYSDKYSRPMDLLEECMPTTIEMMGKDIALLTDGRASLSVLQVIRRETTQGNAPLPSDSEVHLDSFNPAAPLPWYLIADAFPTISY